MIELLTTLKSLLEVVTMVVTLPMAVIRLCQIHKLQNDAEKRRIRRE